MQENSHVVRQKPCSHAGIWIFILIALMGSIACVCTGSGGSEEAVCTTTLTVDGQSYTGLDESLAQSELNACNLYCVDNDPDFLAMYEIYIDANGLDRDAVSRQDSLFDDDALLDQVTLVCAPQCVADAQAGLMDLSSTCSE